MGTAIYDKHHIVTRNYNLSDTSSSSLQDSGSNNMHVMVCPQCKSHSVANGAKFKVDDLSISITCPSCGKRPLSALWHCNCGVAWHTCQRHSKHHYQGTMSQGRSRTRVRSTTSRQIHADVDDLLEEDLLRESKMARLHSKSLGQQTRPNLPVGNIPYRMLPPSLRDKFPAAVLYQAAAAPPT